MSEGSEIDPCLLKDAVRKVKAISREYANGDLEADVRYYQTHRPRLLRNAEITEDKEAGRITYNTHRISTMPVDDQRAIHRYITSQKEIFFLQKAVMGIQNANRRETAVDMILHGSTCAQLTEKYGISQRALYKRKRKIVEYIANLMLSLPELPYS